MTTPRQVALFPEPARIKKPFTVPRYLLFDDEEGEAFQAAGRTTLDDAADWFDTVGEARDDQDGDEGCWLYDRTLDELYEPYEWPEDDGIPGVVLHLAALDGLAEAMNPPQSQAA